MTITIELPAPVERRLAAEAAASGKTPAALAAELIAGALPREKTFDEILAPFRQSVEESGLTDEELDALFQEARQEVWEEQQRRKQP